MKLDVTATIKDLDGEPIRKPVKSGQETGDPFTMRDAIETALLTPLKGDEGKADEAFERFMLAMRVHDANPYVEFKIEEAKTIKDRVAKHYPALTIGRVWQAIEAAANAPQS